jgi:4-amino-4-deoxy-L-arabinose transferase-like glycosyltransferase
MFQALVRPDVLAKALATLPFLLFLPGYLTLLTLRPPAWRPRISHALFASVLLSVLLVSPVALLLAEIGAFSLAAVTLLAALYSLLLGWRLRRKGGDWRLPLASPDRWEVALWALVAVSLFLYGRPHEYILGGADPGVYVNIGANLARTGRLAIVDPLVAETPPAALGEFFREWPASSAVSFERFAAFFVTDSTAGLVVPRFFHLHPVWLALLYGVGGVWAELLLTPLWAVLGGIALYLVVEKLFSRRAALLALLLLTLCPLQLWFARYPTAEALTQFLIYGTIYATVLYLGSSQQPAGRPVVFGLAAGLGWGALLLVRIDSFYTAAVPALITLLLLLSRRWTRRDLWFAVPWGLVTLQALLHALLIARAYATDLFGPTLASLAPHAFILGLGSLAVALMVAFFLAFPVRWQRLVDLFTPRRQIGGAAFAVGIVLAAGYAYFLRPRLGQAGTAFYWFEGHDIPITDHENLVRLGWYLSPLGIGLGTLGLAWMAWRRADWRIWLFLGVGVVTSVLYLISILGNPHHVYAMRRYVPVVVPTVLTGAAVLVDRLASAARRWRLRAVPLGALVLAQIGLMLWPGRVLLTQVDNRGLAAEMDALVEQLPARDLILFDDTVPVGLGDKLGTPLTYLYGLPVMTLRQPEPDLDVLQERLRAWTAAGREVIMVPGHQPAYFSLPGWSLQLVGEFHLQYNSLEASYTRRPEAIMTTDQSIEFYRFVPGSAEGNAELPYRIDVGHGDFGALLGGFYGQELAGDLTFRWTGPAAELELPPGAVAQARTMRMNMATFQPGVEAVPVELVLDGAPWTTIEVEQGYHTYTLPLPEVKAAGDRVTLGIRTAGWSPSASGASLDNRDLGVAVDWIELAP